MNGPATVAYDLGTPSALDEVSFEVHDVMGRRVYERVLDSPSGQFTLNLDLPAGAYLASVRVEGKVLRTLRIIK
jgi:hypothetical protein